MMRLYSTFTKYLHEKGNIPAELAEAQNNNNDLKKAITDLCNNYVKTEEEACEQDVGSSYFFLLEHY